MKLLKIFFYSMCAVFSHVWFFVTLQTVAHQAPSVMGFSRQEYWSGLPFSIPGDLTDKRIELASPALARRSFSTAPPPLLTKIFSLKRLPHNEKKKIKLQSWTTGLWGCERRSLFWRTFGKAHVQGGVMPTALTGVREDPTAGDKVVQIGELA